MSSKTKTRKAMSVNDQISAARKDKKLSQMMDQSRAEMVLARKMSDLIEARKLTVSGVAREMGTSASHLHRILNLEVSPSLATVWRFARAAGCDFDISFAPLDEKGCEGAADKGLLERILGDLDSHRELMQAQHAELLEKAKEATDTAFARLAASQVHNVTYVVQSTDRERPFENFDGDTVEYWKLSCSLIFEARRLRFRMARESSRSCVI